MTQGLAELVAAVREHVHRELAEGFHLLTSRREVHQTPWGAPQVFTHIVCRYTPLSA